MDLSNIIGSGARPYLEYGWVCAPNTAGQSITANTITTLTIDTEVADTGNFGSIASNQITLAAGTYYYNLAVPISSTTSSADLIFGIYNITGSSFISRKKINALYGSAAGSVNSSYDLIGQFTLASQTALDIRAIVSGGNVAHGVGYTAFSLGTSNADQRTTIKLWKLA
jgi:hypothetical protein